MEMDENDDEENIQEEEDSEMQVKKKKYVKTTSDPNAALFPLFLKKMNSTYFKSVNASFLQAQLPSHKKTQMQIERLKTCGDNDDIKCNSILVTGKEKKNYLSKMNCEQQSNNEDKKQKQQQNFLNHLSKKKNNAGLEQLADVSQRETTSTRSNGQIFSNRSETDQKLQKENLLEKESKTNNKNQKISITYQKIQKDLIDRQQQQVLKEIEDNQDNLYKNKSVDFGKVLTIPDLNNSCLNQILNDLQNQTVQACLICFDNEPNAVNMPCGHGGICYPCAVEIMEKTGECYLCRQPIEQVLELEASQDKKSNKKLIKVLKSARLETCEINTEQDDIILNQIE